VIPALLCYSQAAVFAPILALYIAFFETRRKLRSAIPAAVVCAAWWVFQLVMTWRFAPFSRIPAANYWFSQPWVAMRYLFRFVAPLRLSVDSDFTGFAHIWDPLALAGFLGVAALAFAAYRLGKSEKGRIAAFGLWWFLIALAPDALVSHAPVEANWRAFLPFIGLALAIAGALTVAMESWLPRRESVEVSFTGRQITAYVATALVAVAVLAGAGWATFERNKVWESEATLWQDAMEHSPRNGRAIMFYGLTQLNDRNPMVPYGYAERAERVSPADPVIDVNLALANARLSQPKKADRSFNDAIRDGDTYSPSWSSYGQWLFNEDRLKEAADKAARAIELDPYDIVARRTMMDVYGTRHQWAKLKEFSEETLQLLPGDPDGERSLLVAESGAEQINRAVQQASSSPSVDHYLALSVLYFQSQRYQDSIDAARQALKLNPQLGEAYSNIASAYHSMGKLDETIDALQEEIRVNPNLPSAKSNLEFELAVKRGLVKEDLEAASTRTFSPPKE
jgi:tetratricopeptide (TPR) repeat protein